MWPTRFPEEEELIKDLSTGICLFYTVTFQFENFKC